jgi:penicillin-binding protein 2
VVAENIDIRKAITLGELKSDYNNIIIQPRPVRYYPFGKLASHVIGYLNEIDHWRLTKLKDYGYETKDIVGFGGIEEKFDYYLRQQDGALSIEIDHRGKFVRVLGIKPAGNGKDIQLTLDLKIQKIVEDALGDNKNCVILMNPYSGEIVAMANSPDFDPSIFVNKSAAVLANLAESALMNRAISGEYPAASIFKLVSACAGLEANKINLSTTYLCSGSMRIGNRDFACWETHKEQDLADAIAHSCDIFFYKTGLLLGAQAIHDYAVKFCFSKPTGIDLPYEKNGFVPDPLWKRIHKFQNWFDGDTANFVIGQGDVLVTPIQITRFMAVFANHGILVTPYIVKSIGGRDISLTQQKRNFIPIKEAIIDYVRKDLRGVVSETSATANVLADLPISVAGKTGTAQVSRNRTPGRFAGFFPFNDPKFVICVLQENSGSGHSASMLTKQIIEGMIKENLM